MIERWPIRGRIRKYFSECNLCVPVNGSKGLGIPTFGFYLRIEISFFFAEWDLYNLNLMGSAVGLEYTLAPVRSV